MTGPEDLRTPLHKRKRVSDHPLQRCLSIGLRDRRWGWGNGMDLTGSFEIGNRGCARKRRFRRNDEVRDSRLVGLHGDSDFVAEADLVDRNSSSRMLVFSFDERGLGDKIKRHRFPHIFSFDLIAFEHRSRHGKRKGRSTRTGSALFLIPDDIESRRWSQRQDIIETGSDLQILLIASDFKSRLLQPTDRCRRPPDHSQVEAR